MAELKAIIEECFLIIADCLREKPEAMQKLRTLTKKLEKKTQIRCELCGKPYEYWVVPQKWWKRIPEELWDKYLCFECYLNFLREREK